MDALPGTVSNSSNSQVTCPDAYKEVYCVVDTSAFLKAINVADVATLCKERLRLGFLHLKTLKDQGLLVPPKKQEGCEKINDREMTQECRDWEQARVIPTQTRKVKRCINSPSETTGASCIDISSTLTTAFTPETASRTSARRMGREKKNIGHDWDSVESDGYDKKQTVPSPTKQKRTSLRKDNADIDIQNIGRQYQNLPKRSGRNQPKDAACRIHHHHSRSYCPLKRNTHCQHVYGTKTSTKKPIVLNNKSSKDGQLSSPLLCSEACKSHDTCSTKRYSLDVCAEPSSLTSTTDAFTKKNKKRCKYQTVSSKLVTPSSESDATAAITSFPVKSKTLEITVSREVQSNDVSTNVEKLPLPQTITCTTDRKIAFTTGRANISDNKLSSGTAGKSRKNTQCLKDNGYVSASDEQHSFDNTSTVGRRENNVGKNFQRRYGKTVSKKTRRFLILSDDESVDEMVTQKRSTECTTQKAAFVSVGKPVSFNVERKLVECLPNAPAKSLVCGLIVDDSMCDPVADMNRGTENQNRCDQVLSNADKDSHNVTTPQELKQSTLSSKVAQLCKLSCPKSAYVRLERLDMSELKLKIRRSSVEFCRNKPDADQNQKNIKQTAMSDGRGTVEKDRGRDGGNSLGRAAKTKFKRIKSNSENKTVMREQVGVIGSKHETKVKKDSECSSKEKISRKCDQDAKHIGVSPEYSRTIFEIISSAKYEENNNQKEIVPSNATECPKKPLETDNGVEKNTKLDFIGNELESNKKLLVASLKSAVLKHKMQTEEMSKRQREENKNKLNRTNAKLPEQGSKTIQNDIKTNRESQKDVLLQSKRKVKDSKAENEKLRVSDKSVDDSGNSPLTKKKLKTVTNVSDCCVSDIKLPETNSKTNCCVDLIPATDIEAFRSKALSLVSEFDFNGSEDNLGISYDVINDEDKATWAGAAMAIGMSEHDSHSQACGLKAAEIPHMKEEVLVSAMQSVRRKLKMLGLRIEDVPKYLNVDDAWKIACEHPSSKLEIEVCDGIVKFALVNSPQS